MSTVSGVRLIWLQGCPVACFQVQKIYGPQFALYLSQRLISKPDDELCNPLGYSYVKNMLRDQLFKTSGLQFD